MDKKHDGIRRLTIMSFLFPSFIGFIIFIFIPLVMAVFFSLTNYSGGAKFKFIGIKNYVVAFADAKFLNSLFLTFKYMAVTVFFQIVIGLVFALFLARPFRGSTFFRSAFYIPNILSSVAVGLAFMFIFEPSSGLMNGFLKFFNLPTSRWLASEKTSLLVIMMVSIWQSVGYYMVLLIGALQNVNSSLYEAAEIDGAGKIQQFIAVTLPGISPVLFYAITLAVIRGFQAFDYIYVMTGGQQGGGPAGSTNVLAFDIYRNAFMYYRFGFASAESVVLLIIILTVTLIQNYGQKKWVVYDIV
ncbi:sugar ABC transporter permease [Treponema parvum]|uniref:Sugar ABC transporter permease n=1 Tax=Treponema parvum TaxID=138851 RepID=A0A975IFH8_9SPIR|nr:sugar ABC transporter permease [Treponema parvum]QTQ10956.1 sugar ABC transporter permease [Treponema parvum]QTQ14892.1 sugar ABC transporter permease [Treponema parvum]